MRFVGACTANTGGAFTLTLLIAGAGGGPGTSNSSVAGGVNRRERPVLCVTGATSSSVSGGFHEGAGTTSSSVLGGLKAMKALYGIRKRVSTKFAEASPLAPDVPL